MRRFVTAVCALALAAPVFAQDEAEVPLDVTVVEELIARPLQPGPAWWKVSDTDSAVYIMTMPYETPAGLAWDRTVLERRLEGANLYISPLDVSLLDPRSIVGMGSLALRVPGLMLAPKARPEPRPDRPLEETLPEDVRARFVTLREKLDQPADRYAAMTPLEASSKISEDYRRRYPVAELDIVAQVEQAARRHRLRIVPAYRVRVPASGYQVTTERADPAHGPACLDRRMATLERQRSRAVRQARAWAQGDVRPMLADQGWLAAQEGEKLNCFNGGSINVSANSALAKRLDEEFVAGQAATIERALKMPGKSVALLPLVSPLGQLETGMLGRRGVLARLKAKGFEITLPAGVEMQ